METIIYPAFYDDFACLADRCRHSCCKGWEIDIDEDTAEYYEALPVGLGDEIRRNIFYDEDGCHFRMKDDCCPFLEKDGLCRIIKEMGEDPLCDVCALHPRFVSEVGDVSLAGLGLCCEKVCDLLMKEEGSLCFFDNVSDQPFSLPELLRRLHLSETGPEELTFRPHPEPVFYEGILRAYQKLEPIDQEWTEELEELEGHLSEVLQVALAYANNYPKEVYSRILSYILYRQLEHVPEYGFDRILEYAGMAAEFIFLTDAFWGDTGERLRRWSEQVEYSTENVDLLMQWISCGI